MNLIQISKYFLVEDTSNDTTNGCITVIDHALKEKNDIFAHQFGILMCLKVKSKVVLLQKMKSTMCRINV